VCLPRGGGGGGGWAWQRIGRGEVYDFCWQRQGGLWLGVFSRQAASQDRQAEKKQDG
jgi:hypothetical protein